MASGAFFRRPAVLLALALCTVGGVVTLLGRLATGPKLQQKQTALSTEPGTKSYPAFSPDGNRLAYSARGSSKVDAFHIFVRALTAADRPRQLTSGSGNDVSAAWSPDGDKIAFMRLENGHAQYMVVRADGGEEHKVAEFPATGDDAQPLPSVAWMHDSKSLVVVSSGERQSPGLAVVSLDSGLIKRLTNPPEGTDGDSTPAVSPDGQTVAFLRSANPESADIFAFDMAAGGTRQLTFDKDTIRGIAWTADGKELVYSSSRLGQGGWHLWRISASGGGARQIPMAGNQAQYPAVAATGKHLAYSDSPSVSAIWRAALTTDGTVEEQALLRSSGRERSAAYSPDGTKIANISDHGGFDEIWVSDADGNNRVQVTHVSGPEIHTPRWSPDGKTLLFQADSDQGPEVYTVPATGGKPARVLRDASDPSWSQNGKSIYFQSRGQIWKATAAGANPEVVTKQDDSSQPVESADGKYVIFRARRTIWRVPVSGGKEEQLVIPDHDLLWAPFQPTRKGIYYLEWERSTFGAALSFYDYATKKNSIAYRLRSRGVRADCSISPDGKYILYPRVDHSETNLMLLENFR